MSQLGSPYIDTYATPADLDPSEPIGQVALTLDPLTLWVFTVTGYVAVGSASGTAPASPASEAGAGTVELATEAEVQAGTAGVLVATVARLKAELDRRAAAMTPEAVIAPTLTSGWTNFASDATVGSPDNEEGRYVKALEAAIRMRIAEVRGEGV
jgi:hypothetical protein